MPSSRLLPIAPVLALLGGCTAVMDVPPGYVRLRHPHPFDLKAVSARGNVITLTVRPNEDKTADLAFWSQAVEHQKVDLDAMRLTGRESIKSTRGRDGVLFQFELGQGQGKATYLVALYVTSQTICTIEAGGPAAAITEDLPKLREAILSAR